MRLCGPAGCNCRRASAARAVSALAQKSGGILKMYHRDNPPSASIHEEATISTVIPFMGVFNNLVMFDQQAAEQPRTIVPDLAEAGLERRRQGT